MILCNWEKLPRDLQTDEVRPYWEVLQKKKTTLACKRCFDFVLSSILLILLSPLMIVLSIAIKIDSKGPIFYRQERVTQYGKVFRIHKFRSMCTGADQKGALVTVSNDCRITKVGKIIRKFRLDEISQLIDVWLGNMTFVGTRPEVKKYVDSYTSEMMATLLLPAGVTSNASICYKDEDRILEKSTDVDKIYIEEVLPQKMKYNLEDIQKISIFRDLGICFKTIWAVLFK